MMIYAQSLPDVTNLTDWAFYPWLVCSYDQRYVKDDYGHLVGLFRPADCLFTLIAEHHAPETDSINERYSAAIVGRAKLVPADIDLKVGELLSLSLYAATQDTSKRYFMNSFGGLSQYYAGTLADLKLVKASDRSRSFYSNQYGESLAHIVDAFVSGVRFWQVVENDWGTLDDLEMLSGFCACCILTSTKECQQLINIFFDAGDLYAEEGSRRYRSLALIQQLVGALLLKELIFRKCIYSGVLPDGEAWSIPQ
ncbi:hypothetical protein ACPA5B_15750 [Pseudomonas solani]|uniref:hypothetical protein n=1 Tax=Pseudomonas solani TaxID=2731552 RepID=UPI003C2C9E23